MVNVGSEEPAQIVTKLRQALDAVNRLSSERAALEEALKVRKSCQHSLRAKGTRFECTAAWHCACLGSASLCAGLRRTHGDHNGPTPTCSGRGMREHIMLCSGGEKQG